MPRFERRLVEKHDVLPVRCLGDAAAHAMGFPFGGRRFCTPALEVRQGTSRVT
jgi:hypothetical protein